MKSILEICREFGKRESTQWIFTFEQILAQNLSWNERESSFCARFLWHYSVQTVNLPKSPVFCNAARFRQIISDCKIFAFFRFHRLDGAIALKLLKSNCHLWSPLTNRMAVRKSWVNVLMLSVNYENISVPAVLDGVGRKGCSDNAERRGITAVYWRVWSWKHQFCDGWP